MEATISTRAADVQPGDVITDGETYALNTPSIRVRSVDPIEPDEFSTDPDGSVRFNFGQGSWLVVEANAWVEVIA